MRSPWDERYWCVLEQQLSSSVLSASSEAAARGALVRRARAVLRAYSTSFFLVTRFLPPQKRAEVEIVYAAVRYPDEVVDSFPVTSARRLELLDAWAFGYEAGLHCENMKAAVGRGVPVFLAAFTQVVRERGIPPDHYRAFLDAMRLDTSPRPFQSMADLIDSYVYGSAIVVGYFLAYIYGASEPSAFDRALGSSRNLGIALQLTNFLRDVGEDQRRGRLYLPVDLLEAEGISEVDVNDAGKLPALNRVLREMSASAERYYAEAERGLDAFAPDCRTAIRACIDVYRQLNLRIGRSVNGVQHRESVPMRTKFQVLPASKYWRLPLAYLGAI